MVVIRPIPWLKTRCRINVFLHIIIIFLKLQVHTKSTREAIKVVFEQ
jgi:hypothetical protein